MNTVFLFNQASHDCSRCVTGRYSTSFSSAIKLLHPDLRDPIHGIYGFVRLADEIVDTFHDYDKVTLLDRFEADTWSAIREGISLNPVLQSFQLSVNRFHIEERLVAAFFKSMRTDLEKKEWSSREELTEYIYGSAEVVGLMCLQIFCEGDSHLAKVLSKEATALGAAFQKINFLRDLRDDVEGLNRQYFSDVNFTRFSPETKAFIEQDILQDLRVAYRGIQRLPSKARFGVLVAYRYYLCLFRKIRSLPPEVLMRKRVRVPNLQKALLLLRTALGVGQIKLIP
ncbi:phytoene/squalene synthase family protein [Flavitalea sp. BT771]|uniref:phytoene/squalene synthase family protein n=1 Tax=Flavitalea sp. BT771 TaxID=3063329 RepID=UPI0026E13F2A|nr:phytoene/squalene synthase family protein [Flavitalea sp. BT771]MDO6432818.1 phytoene/squalene synthase family protein [Flavitalea sp. BT771]MDV6221906.1 phytoene/squalene synthase family protein [Flavitalea sp. BT771]